MKTILRITFLVSLLICNVTQAANTGPYLGIGGGYAKLSNFSDATNTNTNNGSLIGKIFMGIKCTEFIGFEGGFTSYSLATYNYKPLDNVTLDYKLSIISLVAKLYVPHNNLDSPVDIYAILGAGSIDGYVDCQYYDYQFLSTSSREILGIFGVGTSIMFNKHFAANFEFWFTQGKPGNDIHVGIPSTMLFNLNIVYHI